MADGSEKVRQAGDSLRGTEWGKNLRGQCSELPDIPETVFRVRAGPNYSKNHIKEPSLPPLYEPICVDVFKMPTKQSHICRFVRLPHIPPEKQGLVNGVPPFLVVSAMLPSYDPPNPLWGAPRDDGPGYSVVVYLLLKDEAREKLKNLDSAPPAYRLLRDFIANDQDRVRFKAMANFLNSESVNMGFALRRLLTEYNAKPVLSRPQHSFFTDGESYFEVDIDVHQFNYVARKGMGMIRELVEHMQWDIGFTIEGWTDDELPENILAVIRMHNLHLTLAEEVDFDKAPLVRANGWSATDPEISLVTPPPNLLSPKQIEGDGLSASSSPLQSIVDMLERCELEAAAARSGRTASSSSLAKADLLPCADELRVPVVNADGSDNNENDDDDEDDVFEDAEES
eukprot:m.116295 g.116295  ORF g.116295 m.116295 type:complete len:398 (+) comp16070_c0_seq1:261-1454(+)